MAAAWGDGVRRPWRKSACAPFFSHRLAVANCVTTFGELASEERVLKVAAYILAGLIGLLGLLFLIAAGENNRAIRLTIGLVCLVAAAALVALARLKPIQQTHVHHMKLDLTGDVSLQQIDCRQCGAALSNKSLDVKAGAVFVHCEFCGAQYQLEEAPKW
jgi:hypothetical protein